MRMFSRERAKNDFFLSVCVSVQLSSYSQRDIQCIDKIKKKCAERCKKNGETNTMDKM